MLAVRGLRALALAIAAVLVAIGAIVAIAAPAQAATTDITGTVTSTDGSPIPPHTPIYLSADIANGGLGPSGPLFTSTAAVTTTGAGGAYTISGVVPGFYVVLADAGDDWVQGFAAAFVDGSTDPGAIADIEIEKGVLITGTVHPESNPAATLGGIAVGAVMDCGCGGFFGDGTYFDILTFDWDVAYPQTPGSGSYRIVVPLDASYEVNALDPSATPLYAEQSWDHQASSGGCPCGGEFTPIVTPEDTLLTPWPYAPYAPTSAIDFDLRAYSDYLWFQVKTVRDPGPNDYANVHVFLQYDFGGPDWQDVADAVSDADGFVDFYVTDNGHYRLRFEVGGVQAPVVEAVDAIGCGCASPYLLTEGDTKVELGGYTKSSPADGYFEGADAEVTFAGPPSSGGGGSTPAPPAPRKPTRTSTFSVTDLTAATPTPTPTPTSSPTPSSSPSSEPSASPTPTADPVPVDNPLNLWWLWLLLVLLVAAIIFFIVRALLRR